MAFPGYAVWTRNESPEWLEKNAGCTDMLLVTDLEKQQAESLVERLHEVYGDLNATVFPGAESPEPGSVGLVFPDGIKR
ncbi:hypothetical protein [Streptomyces sp. 5-10]|uniref:hypothetical protein n=1 Tax=Streptomyces sp. 5-10 TaxID=878925 RepID=UPI00168BC582|nr:hypothetical protein [Streptomyces sp. 5-10]MBD3004626.1 hypothetical protein [Streptomyces sp. 5-10]